MGRSIILKSDQNILAVDSQPRILSKPLPSSILGQSKTYRTSQYIETIKNLDIGHRTLTTMEIDTLKKQISAEIGDPVLIEHLIGIMARCRLGPEYHVHTLGISQDIIKHYKIGEHVDAELSSAIPHALQDSYLFVEIYTDCLICVYPDGKTTEIKK